MDFFLMVIWLILSVLVIVCGKLLNNKLGDFVIAFGVAELLLLGAVQMA